MYEDIEIDYEKGLVVLNETSEHRMIDTHLERGFGIVTASRSENSLSKNRSLNRELQKIIQENGLGFIKIVGGYRETVEPDSPLWDVAEEIKDSKGNVIDRNHRIATIMEESMIVPFYDVLGKGEMDFEDFGEFEDFIITLGEMFDQDTVLVSPPKGKGKPRYIVTSERKGEIGSTDVEFDNLSVASVTDIYFSMKEKTLGKAKVRRGVGRGGVKFESCLRHQARRMRLAECYVQAPSSTISGTRSLNMSGAIPLFRSHYLGASTLRRK